MDETVAEHLNRIMAEEKANAPKDLDLRTVQLTIKAVLDHFREGGTYRVLCYQRLGLDYGDIYPDGQVLSNVANEYREVKKIMTEDQRNYIELLEACCDQKQEGDTERD